MPRVTQLNHAEVGKLLRAEGKYRGVRDDLRRRMQPVLATAKADPHDDTGAYENSLHIEDVTTDRAVERVVAGTDHAWIVEANFGVLARALDQAGGE